MLRGWALVTVVLVLWTVRGTHSWGWKLEVESCWKLEVVEKWCVEVEAIT